MLDTAKNMKHKYKVLNPLKWTKDVDHNMYGPIQLLSILQQIYGRFISTNDRPKLSTKLPQSNVMIAHF
jgi:hypothetical protein